MNILYFALIREHIGKSSETLDDVDGLNSVGDLLAHLESMGENYKAAFAQPDLIRVAVNNEYVGLDHQIDARDEIAIFPPMTGG